MFQCKIAEWASKAIFHEWLCHEWNIYFWCSRGEIYAILHWNKQFFCLLHAQNGLLMTFKCSFSVKRQLIRESNVISEMTSLNLCPRLERAYVLLLCENGLKSPNSENYQIDNFTVWNSGIIVYNPLLFLYKPPESM